MCHNSVTHILHMGGSPETTFVIVATKVCSAFFSLHCCLSGLVLAVSVSLHCLCHAVQMTQVWSLPTPASWLAVSAIQAGWGVVDSTVGSPSCLMSFMVVIPDELRGKVNFEQ